MNTKWGLSVRGICEFQGKVLLLKIRSNSAHDAGLWEIPGGKVKKCEFFDDALKREYLEETGLEINVESLYDVVKNNYISCKTNEDIKSIQLIMKVTTKGDEVIISNEHDDYRWFSWDEIEEMISDELLTPPAIDAFNQV